MRGFLSAPERDDYRAIVRVKVMGPAHEATMSLEIDTGAAPSIIMSQGWARHLGITGQDGHSATLADGSLRPVQMGSANVEWLGETRQVEVVIWDDPAGQLPPISSSRRSRYRGTPDGLVGRSLLKLSALSIDYPKQHVDLKPSAGTASI